MRDWHFEHMQKTIVMYVFGLSESEKESSWKQKQHKKYGGNLTNVRRNINCQVLISWGYILLTINNSIPLAVSSSSNGDCGFKGFSL